MPVQTLRMREVVLLHRSIPVENRAQMLWGALLVLYLLFDGRQYLGNPAVYAVFGVSAGAALLELYLRRRQWRWLLLYDVLVWTCLLTAMVIVTGGRSSELWLAYLLMSLTAPTVERPVLCYGLLAFNSLLYASVYWLVNPHGAEFHWSVLAVRIGLFFLVAYVVQRSIAREVATQRARLAEITLARDAEQKRIAMEIHDWLGAGIAAPLLKLELASRQSDPQQTLAEASAMLRRSHAELRRLMEDLHPHLLEQMGLAGALRAYVTTWSQESGIPATCHSEGDVAPPAETALAAYRIMQEALTNVLKHSGATRVNVVLHLGAQADGPYTGLIRLAVTDNGSGMAAKNPGQGRGVSGMRERAEACGGTITIRSDERGTRVEATLLW